MGLTKLLRGLVLVLQFCALNCKASSITVYAEGSYIGKSESINISKCSNINQSKVPYVGSVELNGNCARLHDQHNCLGNFIELYKGVPDTETISKWKTTYLKGNVKSIGPCPIPCYQQTYKPNNSQQTIEIFDKANYKGDSRKITLDQGCSNINGTLNGNLTSVKTNKCVRLSSHPSCLDMGPSVQNFELRPGTPYHNNLAHWGVPEIKGISLCSFNCPNDTDLNVPVKDQTFLFSEANFMGTMKKLNLSIEICTTFQSKTEIPSSIKVGVCTCAILFSEENCNGTSYIVKVSVYNFSIVTKSIAHCNYTPPEPTTIDPFTSTSTMIENTNDTVTGKPEPKNDGNSEGLPLPTIVIICSAVCAGLIVLALAAKCLKNKLFIRVREKLPEKDIKEFFDGYDISMITTETDEQPSTEILAQSQPYNKNYEVPRSRIDYDMGKLLRKSDLDIVYEGTIAENTKNRISIIGTIKKVPVTVKMANTVAGLNGLQSILKEIKVMIHLGKHENIAYMVGCCTENLRQGKLLLLMEYFSVGTLKSYLQANRQVFARRSENMANKNENLAPMIHDFSPQFDTKLLLQWCIDISRGMEFLSSANIVHSDLAAINILLTNNLQAKISDFGLSRQMYCYSKNVHTQQEPLPWRWMAIESVLRLEFTTKSDVWSYGILCWEIFTLGEMPYDGIRSKDDYISNWEEGLRLEKPQNATDALYTLLIMCWENDSKRRPTFMEITKSIEEQLLLYL